MLSTLTDHHDCADISSISISPQPATTQVASVLSNNTKGITILFDSICSNLKADRPSLLDLQRLCVLSRVNKLFLHQVLKTWKERLSSLTKNENMIRVIQNASYFQIQRAWFQLARFNLPLDSMKHNNHDLVIQAALNNCPELLELALASLPPGVGANVQCGYENWRNTMLINAATRGQKEIVRILLGAKAQIETRNTHKQTALISVVQAIINPPPSP